MKLKSLALLPSHVGLVVLASGLLPVVACTPGRESPTAPLPQFDAARILDDVRVLSSDAMEGRGAGTKGEEKAVEYIEKRFQQAGLEPVAGSYRQAVELIGMRRVDDASSLEIKGPKGALRLRDGETVSYWSTVQQEAVQIDGAPLLFVGYGVEAPEYQWDDFKGADVAGKVLLFLNNDPPVQDAQGNDQFGGEARTYYGRWTYKFEQAMRHGAAGAVVIHTTPSASYGWSVISGEGTDEHFALDTPGSGYQVPLLAWLNEEQSQRVAKAMGTDLEGLFERAAARDFRPVDTGFRVNAHVETRMRKLATHNVLGMLPGSDPELADQVLVFTAHYDHLGMAPDAPGDDHVYNGAWDNASGTASIVALAESFAAMEQRPRRSLLFLACAAEESGSLGSEGFVAQPPIERSRLVGDINLDMPQIFGITADLAAIGFETNTLGDALLAAAADTKVTQNGEEKSVVVTGDPDPNAGSFYRSDQVNFAKAGIPALFVNPGGDYLEPLSFDPKEYEDQHYHQLNDEVGPEWNLAGLARDLDIVRRAALIAANADAMPRWKPGNEFEEEWRKLHGME